MKLGNRLEWMSENLRAPGYREDFGRFVLHLPTRTSDWRRSAGLHPCTRTSSRTRHSILLARHPVRDEIGRIKVPVFSVGGWYDNFVESDLAAYAALRQRSSVNRILIGPWPHNMSVPFEG